MFTGYYYLHTNGDLIYKPNANLEDMLDSDFVKRFWQADEFGGSSPQQFLENLKDAKESGASNEALERLVAFNNLDQYIPNCREELGL